ncbi:anhydro-N-acetylmuramic acid kinase [Prolixibacteraceae bacterium Z1-6]|uniref:Anhydro-N-acetylmuramic acid kinase n=1 Tax=Draconibacterium aestuarii TaxID=2998507 RepID=A0A9X3FB92_9BACT|nr:anhydro-N-acetylmuramic acid kinase [Prolixibacteraceae bacterium Z1-6]
MNKNRMHSGTIKAIGVMSGTSLDGLDIAAVEFQLQDKKWSFKLCEAKTISYSKDWEEQLKFSPSLHGEELTALHSKYGSFIGEQVKHFIESTNFAPSIIASHGHTVFHQPEKGYTLQIGNGAAIAAKTNVLTVSDFRTGDVALGGQGAPLVPIGDQLLFSEYSYCLNLGGFANISFGKDGTRQAFDNCPVNFVLNHFAEKKGLPYDKNGDLGRHGNINTELLDRLNKIPFYQLTPPKSLGREWVETEFFPVLNQFNISDADKMRTVYEHVAIQITNSISGKGKMLITGGGAFNSFLIERIKALTTTELIIPSKEIIDFKEAIIFAFLGVLRINNINNCLASVTGAKKDSCGGVVYLP